MVGYGCTCWWCWCAGGGEVVSTRLNDSREEDGEEEGFDEEGKRLATGAGALACDLA